MAGEAPLRRLTTIVAADVAGYSRLTAADEEATLVALRAHRVEFIDPKIAEYRGRIANTAGDSLLMEFSSVVEALRCAIDLQRGMRERNAEVTDERRIEFRIGINLGDVVEQDGDLLGDGVNVAARLEALAEPGGVCISDDAYRQIRDRVSVDFEDMGEVEVKNIARPVHVYRALTEGEAPRRPRRQAEYRKVTAAAATLILFAFLGSLVWWQIYYDRSSGILPSLSDKPSVAVLPFTSRGEGSEDDYFSDGITEDITTLLGRYDELVVMAFNAVLPYKGEMKSPADIRRELGVRYLVDGSVQRAAQRVRVNVRLTDSQDGVLLWSERFDDEITDVFAVQDTIARRVAGTLGVNLRRVEQQRAAVKPTESLDAYDLVLRARSQMALATRSGNREARNLLRRATEIDPEYAAAYAWLARAYLYMAIAGWTEFPNDMLAKAERLAQKTLSLDPDTIEAYRVFARIHILNFRYDRALADVHRALTINPSDAEVHADRGLVFLWTGHLQKALASFETAFAFDPYLRIEYIYGHGLTLYLLRRHEESVRVLENGIARYRDNDIGGNMGAHAVLAASYAQSGRRMDAERIANLIRSLSPIFEPSIVGSRLRDDSLRDYVAEGMIKAGLTKPAQREPPR